MPPRVRPLANNLSFLIPVLDPEDPALLASARAQLVLGVKGFAALFFACVCLWPTQQSTALVFGSALLAINYVWLEFVVWRRMTRKDFRFTWIIWYLYPEHVLRSLFKRANLPENRHLAKIPAKARLIALPIALVISYIPAWLLVTL